MQLIFPLKIQTIVANVASLDLHKHHCIEGGGEEGASVEHLANTFNFSHGQKVLRLKNISKKKHICASNSKVVVKSEINMGIMEAWRNAWSWKEKELFIVIEDDVEMSPHWYKAFGLTP